MKTSCLLLSALWLCACNKAPSDIVPADPDVAAAPASARIVDEQVASSASSDTGILKITPVKTENCRPRAYTAEVSWQIPKSDPHTNNELRIGKVDGGLMAYKKGHVASATTGNWVKPGTLFLLVDRESREIIAQTTAGTYNCQ